MRNEPAINLVRQCLTANAHTSTRAIAAVTELPKSTVHVIVKHDLRMRPWKRWHVQELFPGDPERRLQFVEWAMDQVIINNSVSLRK